MSADGNTPRQVTQNAVYETEAELSPDGSQVLFIAEASDGLEPYYNSNAFLAPAGGGSVRPLVRDFPHAIDHASWSRDGKVVFASANLGVRSEVFRIDVATGDTTALTGGEHAVVTWQAVPEAGQLLVQLDEPTRLGDAWVVPMDGTAAKRVTGVFDALSREFRLPRQEQVTWKGVDGVTIEGLLFYPLDYTPGRRYPLVVQLHGGPAESDKFGYGAGFIMNYVPVLTAKGYAVLRPNYRGSAGYGNAFLRDVVGHYFNQMHLDVLAGIDAVVAKGIADPDRLAVMGSSAGAHLTNKLITVTTRFKAASSWGGVANWVSMFAETDTRSGRSIWFGGTPWEKDAPVDAFWTNSPLKDVSRVKTPTMLIVGENDTRVPPAQSIEMYRGLVANHVPTRLYIVERETHQWVELRHQVFKANAELEWFERYVMGRGYTWETPPVN
jgi:dipeptidyl aminopeptidase/acylaminoacyl peptidase